jgi:hypothetical protein
MIDAIVFVSFWEFPSQATIGTLLRLVIRICNRLPGYAFRQESITLNLASNFSPCLRSGSQSIEERHVIALALVSLIETA